MKQHKDEREASLTFNTTLIIYDLFKSQDWTEVRHVEYKLIEGQAPILGTFSELYAPMEVISKRCGRSNITDTWVLQTIEHPQYSDQTRET